jgi:hypothetical protein
VKAGLALPLDATSMARPYDLQIKVRVALSPECRLALICNLGSCQAAHDDWRSGRRKDSLTRQIHRG